MVKKTFLDVAMLEGTTYKESASALEDCEIAIIPREEFELLVYKDKPGSTEYFLMLAKNITETENKLISELIIH